MLCVDGGKDLWGLEQLSVELRIKICYHCDGYRCNVDIIFVRLVEENPTDNRKPVKNLVFVGATDTGERTSEETIQRLGSR